MELRNAPDLLSALRLQSQITDLRGRLDAAAKELTTGVAADIVASTGGDLSPVFGIEADLTRLADVGRDLGAASARAAGAQAALGTVQDSAGDLGLRLLNAVTSEDPVGTPIFAREAGSVLESVVTTLNTQFGGRALFSGAAVDRQPLADDAVLVADITAIVAAAPDAATAIADIDTYFDTAGGGFETNIYRGAQIDAPATTQPDGSRVSYLVRADSTEIREVLKGLVMSAVSDTAGFAADPGEMNAFLRNSAERMVAARDGITAVRAEVGAAEAQIQTARSQVEVERTTLQLARNDLIGIDQYEAAGRVAALEGNLQMLFLVTGRLSALSLTNYIR